MSQPAKVRRFRVAITELCIYIASYVRRGTATVYTALHTQVNETLGIQSDAKLIPRSLAHSAQAKHKINFTAVPGCLNMWLLGSPERACAGNRRTLNVSTRQNSSSHGRKTLRQGNKFVRFEHAGSQRRSRQERPKRWKTASRLP